MARNPQAIIDLENRFWQSMVDKDAKAAKAMIADEGIVAGPSGTMRIDPDTYEAMTEKGQWTLETFEMENVDVLYPADDVAIIAYQVHQTGTMKGEAMDLRCADTSTWVKSGDAWKCVLHTESVMER